MIHYTLNTGHTRVSPRNEVRDEVIEVVSPLLNVGEHDMPIEGYRLVTDAQERCLLATVYRDKVPLVTIAVAPDDESADALWPQIESMYLKIGDLPGIRSADFESSRRPEATPWCACVIAYPAGDAARWLGDFERCLAWAWIETQGGD